MGKKNRRKGDDDFEKDFEIQDSDQPQEQVEAQPTAAAPKKKKDKKKDKKKGKAAAFDSDDNDQPQLQLEISGGGASDDEEEEPISPVLSSKSKKKAGRNGVAAAFALLQEDDDDDQAEGEGGEEGEESDDEVAPGPKGPPLVVAEVLSVDLHPQADRLRVCQLDAGGTGPVTVVTNAPNVEEGMKVVLAPVGSTTPGSGLKIERASLRGVESHGMLCSAFDIGWVKEADGVLAEMPEEAEVGEECPQQPPEGAVFGAAKASKKEKKKKKGEKIKEKGSGSMFAALAEEGDEEKEGEGGGEEGEEDEEVAPKKGKDKKKKKKAGFDTSAAFAALALEESGEEGSEGEEEALERKEKKKKKKGSKQADLDSVFAALGGEEPEGEDDASAALAGAKKKSKKKKGGFADVDIDALLAEEEAPAPAPEEKKGKGKKGKKGKGGGAKDDEDLDALLAELDGPKAPAPSEPPADATSEPAAGGKGKKKKKGKGGAKDEDDDLDAILAELGMEAPEAQPAAPAAQAAPVAAAAEASPAGDAEEQGEEEGDKELSAAAKKKAKRKAKEKAKKAGAGEEGGAAAEEAADGVGEGKKGGKKTGGKVSAAVRRMQEAIEAQRKAQEEAERLAEEAERRRQEKAERRAQLKKEGKLLTGKAKAEAERLARVREQFLRQAGLDPDAVVAPKKKPVYDRRKKKLQPKKGAEAEAEDEESAEQQTAEARQSPAPEESSPMQVEAAAPSGELEADVVDSWEEAAVDDWEAMDVDDIKLPGQVNGTAAEEPSTPAVESAAKSAAVGKAAAAAAAAASEQEQESEEDSEEESDSEGDSSSEEGSSSEEDSSDEDSDSDSEEDTDSEDEMEARVEAARARREAALQAALANRDTNDLRSPVCCILGHVDTGKTKILDNIRRTNVQDGEAGGITQQIGATYIPADAIKTRTEELRKGRQFDLRLPGLLVIDTPGHESFSNLRSRGSGLCDIAILVVDLMHGLEQQTMESINLLKMRSTPFIIAMNKVDRLYGWKEIPNSPIQDALARQEEYVRLEFENRLKQVSLELNEQGLNVALYWRNRDPSTYHSIVPTSAITGEGIPDMLQLMVKLTQSLMVERLMFVNHLQCTVLEVKQIEGLGTTIDVVLVNGQLKEGDTIVVCGLGGPIVTTVRALLTPHPLKELRVKGSYQHHKTIRAAMGVKIAAHNLESAVAGTQLYVVGPEDDVEAIKEEVMEDMTDIFSSVDKTGEGVCVQASTLGSLEALLEFLRTPEVSIPVSAINIGPVHKKDVMRANVMNERGVKKFGVILAFDVAVNKEAREMAEELGVKIFTADIIYHLFDQFTAYLKTVKEEEQEAAKLEAVFPCVLHIMPTCVFNKKDPIVVGVEIAEGVAKIGTPICVPSQGGIDLGRIASMEKDHKAVETAKRGDAVAMKIEPTNATEGTRLYGRHFDHTDELVSKISRKSINVLKEMFRDEMTKDDWKLVIKLKKVFKID